MTGLKLQYKIVIPFILLFVGATAVIAFTSLSAISRTLDSRLSTQIEQASAMVSQAGFARNAPVLERLKEALGADVVTFHPNGGVLATTLGDADAELVRAVLASAASDTVTAGDGESVVRDIVYEDVPFRVAYRALTSPPGSVVAVVASTADVAAAQQSITRTVLFVSVVIVLLMAVASHLVARSVTAPVLRLVEYANAIAGGADTGPAPLAGRDEVGRLAQSFSEMVGQLRASEARMLRSEKVAVTGLLAARVAHDVRNPLSSMKMQAQMLRHRLPQSGEDQELVHTILKEIDRVEWVVKGLLELSRPGDPQLRSASVNDVVEDALGDLSAQLRYQKVVVETELEPDLPLTALDVDRVKLALLNLMVNAAEAMASGGTMLVATRLEDDGRAIGLEIRDDGVGVDPAVRDKLFDPFVSTKREGVGLGLVNARHIVESHDGTIEIAPRPSRGTCVRVVLPVVTARSPVDDTRARHALGTPDVRQEAHTVDG